MMVSIASAGSCDSGIESILIELALITESLRMVSADKVELTSGTYTESKNAIRSLGMSKRKLLLMSPRAKM